MTLFAPANSKERLANQVQSEIVLRAALTRDEVDGQCSAWERSSDVRGV